MKNTGKKVLIVVLVAAVLTVVIFLVKDNFMKDTPQTELEQENTQRTDNTQSETAETDEPDEDSANEAEEFINPDGTSVSDRFIIPAGYTRVACEPGSFGEFLQNLPLKPDGTKVRYYDGSEKPDTAYLAVIDYTLGDRDLQQCADSVIRLRAEYLYAAGKTDEITFHFVSGFEAVFSKWSQGYGISISGNDVSWVNKPDNDGSYESFQRYLDVVYAYASTLSLEKELTAKDIADIAVGDVFIIGGSPGHCEIVVDMAVNAEGEKAFILAQGYMPAQDIQILRGEEYESPWNFTEDLQILRTPEYTFELDKLKTWD